MCAVAVHLNAVDLLAVDISSDVAALLHDQAFLPRLLRLLGKDRTEQAGAYNQIIIFHSVSPLAFGLTFIIITDSGRNSN